MKHFQATSSGYVEDILKIQGTYEMKPSALEIFTNWLAC